AGDVQGRGQGVSPPPKGRSEGRTLMVPAPKRPATMHSVKPQDIKPQSLKPQRARAVSETAPLPPPPPPSPPTRPWKPFRWASLEKVSRLQAQLVKRLEWMMPGMASSGELSQTVRERLHELLEEEVAVSVDYVHVAATRNLRRYISDPTFLAVLGAQPN